MPHKEGRSGVVSRDVRATIKKVLPSLIRTILGNDAMVWNLYNSGGAAVRNMSFRESDGLLSLAGGISATLNISAGGAIVASAGIYAGTELGVGAARLSNEGNILFQGGMSGFGALLSDALSARPPAQTIGAGGVGSYAFAYRSSPANMGDLVAGSTLVPAGVAGQQSGATLPGTWRCMGYCVSGSSNSTTLWLRVS